VTFFMRRAFDFVCSFAGLVALSPLLVIVAALVKLEDHGPVFFRHRRMGRNFRVFGLWKFRTMVPDADRLGGPLTQSGDRRVTKVGKVLRRYKLDELPQLLNVLSGEIALVGARPESERYVEMFRAQYEEILRERPGITDPASLTFRDEEALLQGEDVEKLYVSEILPRKLELALQYSRQRTFWSDLGIILSTVYAAFRPLRKASSPSSGPQALRDLKAGRHLSESLGKDRDET